VVHQAYYSLAARDYEWELMSLALDQKVGTIVWSPLAGGALSGKVRRGQPLPEGTRASQLGLERAGDLERLYRTVETLERIAGETGRSVAQVALNWVLQRPTVTSIVLGARNETQLRENLGAVGWTLSAEQISASAVEPTTQPTAGGAGPGGEPVAGVRAEVAEVTRGPRRRHSKRSGRQAAQSRNRRDCHSERAKRVEESHSSR
jgi:aryl-alcohol dehydrogenase-like predicted oxidoreductase